MPKFLDLVISRYLEDRYGELPRRAFLSKVTRGLFLVAGVPLAMKANLIAAEGDPNPQAELTGDSWEWCGMHGVTCSGKCDPNANGNVGTIGTGVANAWTQCCKDKSNGQYTCMLYKDYCGTRGPNYKTDVKSCAGNLFRPGGITVTDPTDGTQIDAESAWCGAPPPGSTGKRSYICTDIVKDGTYGSYSDCRSHCAIATNPIKCKNLWPEGA